MKHPRCALRLSILLKLVVVLVFPVVASLPVRADESKETVQALVDIFVHWSGSADDKVAYAKAGQQIDYRLMSERVLGQKRWDGLSNQDRNDFVTAFRAVIEKRYYPRWRRIFHNSTITYLNEQSANGDTLVGTRVKTGDSAGDITWTVSQGSKVVSLQVGERDLIKRASARFEKKLAKSDFKDFLAWLKKESQRSSSSDIGDTEDTSKGQQVRRI
jgi:ABC-type transporter MlaC component